MADQATELSTILTGIFDHPPVPFDPNRSTLKAWTMYCLRDRGFKVIYADKGDFAIEVRGTGKIYVRVTENPAEVDGSAYWIVRDPATQRIAIVAPEA
jgi:hypothetical protein